MKFYKLSLDGAYLIKPDIIEDTRGGFSRIYCMKEFESIGINKKIVQANHSINKYTGTIRGMHYQNKPKLEAKFVKCIKGKIYDVIVDIRGNSYSFLKSYGRELSEHNMEMLYIPEGFAHGFQVLQDNSELLYFHTEFYDPAFEGGLRYDDPKLEIKWPLQARNISQRDFSHPLINHEFKGLLV